MCVCVCVCFKGADSKKLEIKHPSTTYYLQHW